jgi:hypothetical protein
MHGEHNMTMWLFSVETVVWDHSDFRLNLYFVLHFVLFLFNVLTVVYHWGVLRFSMLVLCVL